MVEEKTNIIMERKARIKMVKEMLFMITMVKLFFDMGDLMRKLVLDSFAILVQQ